MYKKRLDTKGRVLHRGESQRKDGIYQFRYSDEYQKRHTIYDKDLNSLREKEKEILRFKNLGTDYSKGVITAAELFEIYIENKRNINYKTICNYKSRLKKFKEYSISNMQIRDITRYDAKRLAILMHDDGFSYNTIATLFRILRPCFEEAVIEGGMRYNPFRFNIGEVVPKEVTKKEALSLEEQKSFLEFVKSQPDLEKYYNIIFILLNTGLRRSEFCALTVDDIDYSNNTLTVNKQVSRRPGSVAITPPKTSSGIRKIPVSQSVIDALNEEIANGVCSKTYDGYSGFIFKSTRDSICFPDYINVYLEKCVNAYNDCHEPIIVTPHILRHTYCSNMIMKGVSPKTLQYIMGHANIEVTMNIYTHINLDFVEDELHKILY